MWLWGSTFGNSVTPPRLITIRRIDLKFHSRQRRFLARAVLGLWHLGAAQLGSRCDRGPQSFPWGWSGWVMPAQLPSTAFHVCPEPCVWFSISPTLGNAAIYPPAALPSWGRSHTLPLAPHPTISPSSFCPSLQLCSPFISRFSSLMGYLWFSNAHIPVPPSLVETLTNAPTSATVSHHT